ncbi:hypothetical protein [Rhodanobacter geophilus]|uniref:Uncharacterized protein n=1 Tax=Rhodanobacter geophilus TaxID=3162488 RepID=A0ABV3QSI8_9GAMM
MSTQADTIQPPPETLAVPLRFARHNFEAFCYSTLSCRVIYNDHDFTRDAADKPSPPPPSPDYKSAWPGVLYVGIDNFPAPAKVQWTSLDGVRHATEVDLAKVFKDQLIWHKVPKSDMADFYSGSVAGEPNIYLEVKDRTINVYMEMLIPTKSEQIPGNKLSYGRDDLFLVWTHIY